MTPKDKAKYLLNKYHYKVVKISGNPNDSWDIEKQCALICVDEKKETIDKMFNGYYTMPKEWQEEYDNLDKVRQEINKL